MKKLYIIREGQNAKPADRFATETNDCTVNAISNVTGLPYPTVHAYLKAAGRPDRHGFRTYSHFGSERIALGHKFTNLIASDLGVRNGMTVGRFAQTHPRGRFLVCISRHALTVLDGVIVDSARAKPRARIKNAWLVEKVGAAPTKPAVASSVRVPASGSLPMRKVARGHFKTHIPVRVTRPGGVQQVLASLEILSGRWTGRTDWTWKLTAPAFTETGYAASMNAAKALFKNANGPHRNWTLTWQTGLGWTASKYNG